MAVAWKRLWQPRHPMFWMMVGFNVLSSLCTWAMRALPLNTVGLLLLAFVALLNVGCGLMAAWALLRTEPSATKETPPAR
jgi:4-hydroxybenzoate polyprenyltransferase